MASTASAAAITIIVTLSFVSHAANGSANEAQREAKDTYRVKTNTIIQTARIMSNDVGTSAASTPAEVAMPFPPLKCSQQVKLCPRTAQTPAQIFSHS